MKNPTKLARKIVCIKFPATFPKLNLYATRNFTNSAITAITTLFGRFIYQISNLININI